MKDLLEDAPELMTPGEAREALGYRNEKSVARLAQYGVIRFTRTPGGHRRYWAEDIRRLAQHRRQS